MKYMHKLPDADELLEMYQLTPEQKDARETKIKEVQHILTGRDNRKILLIGPCSADREDAVVEYMLRLARLQEIVSDRFVIIPRVYTSKPRTNGMGYKGLIHNPGSANEDDLMDGVIATRKMHLHVIQKTGFYCVDEMLYPESIYYILDLLAYAAVGARSVEDQAHRMTASGLQIPVGMKNPMSGDTTSLLNAISAAQHSHSMMYRGWDVRTEGNPYAHAIFRGFVNNNGKACPNYHYEDLCEFHDKYQEFNLKNMALIIDCNHSNSGKRYAEQVRIAKEVCNICKVYKDINRLVKGLMIESYIEDGNQLPGSGVYGKSITDGCLGWEKTQELILELSDNNF